MFAHPPFPMSPSRRSPAPLSRVHGAVFASCAVALISIHAPLIGYKAYANVDEGYAVAIGERLNEGFKLYEGAISQRGPFMYYFFAALTRTFGWDNIVALRIAALFLVLVHVGLVAGIAWRFLSTRAAVVAAVVTTYALGFGLPSIDGMALHAESLQVPFLLGGSIAIVLATRTQRRRVWLIVGGLLFGAAVSIKQSALLQPLPSLLWLMVESRGGKGAGRQTFLHDCLLFAGALATVPLFFVAHAAVNGTLESLVYYTFTYNLTVHLRPSEVLLSSASLIPLSDNVVRLTAFTAATVGLSVALGRYLVRRLRRAFTERSPRALYRSFDLRVYFTLHFLVATGSGAAMYRFFPHYFVPSIPFLGLAIAGWLKRPLASARIGSQLEVSSASFLIVVAIFATYINEKIDGRVGHEELVQKVGAYVARTTKPDAKLFVWGFSPWLYGYSHRRPAGRYVFETYVTGFVPWFHDILEQEPARVVPGSMDALLHDLARETPEVVVDAGSVMIARPMRSFAPAAEWLRTNYCFELRIGAYDIYRRRVGNAPCASSQLPRPHEPVDFYGNSIPVSMPPLAAGEPSLPLCTARPSDATWFAEPPAPVGIKQNHPPLDCSDR